MSKEAKKEVESRWNRARMRNGPTARWTGIVGGALVGLLFATLMVSSRATAAELRVYSYISPPATAVLRNTKSPRQSWKILRRED